MINPAQTFSNLFKGRKDAYGIYDPIKYETGYNTIKENLTLEHYRQHLEGKISLGVIDQRIDNIESTEDIIKAIKPALKYFTKDRILLTSECGFGHVPIDIVRSKIKKIVEVAKIIRE